MKTRNLLILVLACLFLGGVIWAQEKDKENTKENKKEDKKEITLEKLFPEKSFFGPSARSMAFSFDGKYAAYTYRPYKERRHGSDLWIYDVAKGEARRITSASMMAEFQESTWKVCEDREKKAKAAMAAKTKKEGGGEKKEGEEKSEEDTGKTEGKDKDTEIKEKGKTEEGGKSESSWSGFFKRSADDEDGKGEKDDKGGKNKESGDKAKKQDLGNQVGDDDADDEDAPRYGGIRSFTWSPTANELLFTSGGDLYRYKVNEENPTRLTRAGVSMRSVDWLPDGSGYLYFSDDILRKVVFGCHLLVHLNPDLPPGETMSRYSLSPDGKRLALVTSKGGTEYGGGETKVSIANYRDRFMKAREVSRFVSDDPVEPREMAVYLYELDQHMTEKSALVEVYRRSLTQVRDFVQAPEWSPDSQQVVFTVYDQVSSQISLMEASFPKKDEKDGKDKKPEAKESAGQGAGERRMGEQQREEQRERGGRRGFGFGGERSRGEVKKETNPAKEVYRFLHNGGPTTPQMIRPYYLADNRRIVFLSEQTGFRHLHVLDPVYQNVTALTQGRFEVYPIEISKDHKWFFATATKEASYCADVYRISLEDGTMIRLSNEKGRYSAAAVSPDGKKFLSNFVCYGALTELVFMEEGAEKQKKLTDSHPPLAKELTEPRPEFFSYENRQGQEIYGHLFKPADWKKEDKRPLLIYIYGGPLGTTKQVVEGSYSSASYFFAYYMAKKHGYITCTIDPRGNSGYGAIYEKANFDQVGKPQVEDLVDGVNHLVKEHGVDAKRVAIHGWSFGGFQTQMCLYTEPEVFAAGIAGAGPTEWENYNAYYTSATIGISKPGSAELKKFSLLPLAKNLKAKLLLVHGVEDSNVLYQDTVRVYRELLKAEKETLVELFIDPTGGHGLGGDVKSLNRYRKYEEFLLRTVGEGKILP